MTIESAPMTDTRPTIEAVLRDYRLSNMVFEGTDEPFCLVDLLSKDSDSIETGQREIELIADQIAYALLPPSAAPKPQGDDLEPVADDLVERLRAHEGIGAAMAPTHGTGRYVCAIMDEAAAALQSLKAERDAALRIINMSPADHTRSAVP